jgi:hypothetical protein
MAMIADKDIRSDYSPIVSMRLEANGQVWKIAKLGPDHFVPVGHPQIPACNGVIVMVVDGQERRWNVRIVTDVLPFDDDVKILHREIAATT